MSWNARSNASASCGTPSPVLPALGLAHDPGVGEDVEGVAARRRELGDDRALSARLERVQRVRRDRVLVARSQHDLARTLDVQVYGTAADAERLLLARPTLDWRVPMLGATLVREQDELLRAHAIGVHVDDDLQSDFLEPAQPEVRDLHVLAP